jgi:flagellin
LLFFRYIVNGKGVKNMKLFANYSLLRTLHRQQRQMNHLSEQLSSGKRINHSSDDPAGLAIANRMSARSSGIGAGLRNINNVQSLFETIDGGLSQLEDVLLEMKETTAEARDGTLSPQDRSNLQAELDSLTDTYHDIVSTFSFNEKNWLNDNATYDVNTGIGNFSFDSKQVSSGGSEGVDLSGLDVSSSTNAQASGTKIQASLDIISDTRVYYGGKMNALEFRQEAIQTEQMNLEVARSRIEDADMAKAMSDLTKMQILEQANLELLQQRNNWNYNILALFEF